MSDDVRVGVAIQTHPARTVQASQLASQLPGCWQVYDPRPHHKTRSPWRTYRFALERALVPRQPFTHLLVIQDDALLCDNFMEALPLVVAAQPDRLITMFVASVPHLSMVSLRRACYYDEPFALLPTNQWVPAIAVVWPVGLIGPALEWVDRQGYPEHFSADDEIIGRVVRALNVEVVATVPSLVDHPDDVPSIARTERVPSHGKNPMRTAYCFIDGDPLEIDWAANGTVSNGSA